MNSCQLMRRGSHRHGHRCCRRRSSFASSAAAPPPPPFRRHYILALAIVLRSHRRLPLLGGDDVLENISGLYVVTGVNFKRCVRRFSSEEASASIPKRCAASYSDDGSDFTVATGNADVIITHR
jgi:hypothetical protein